MTKIKNVKNVFYTYGLLRLLMAAKNKEQNCVDTIGTVLVPWSGRFLFPMLKYKYIFFEKIYGSNFIKQHSETVIV